MRPHTRQLGEWIEEGIRIQTAHQYQKTGAHECAPTESFKRGVLSHVMRQGRGTLDPEWVKRMIEHDTAGEFYSHSPGTCGG